MSARLSKGAEELIAAVVEYLLQGGVPKHRICDALSRISRCVGSGEHVSAWHAGMSAFVHKLSSAYETWWTHHSYLDDNGRPIRLPLRAGGRRPSVERLLSTMFDKAELPSAVDALSCSPSVDVADDGTWIARDAALILLPEGELSYRRTVGLVKGLLSTIHANNSAPQPGLGLFERTVMSGNLPSRLLPSLKKEVHEQFGQALFAMQRLIRNAEQRPGQRSGTELGVEVFVYELPTCDETKGDFRSEIRTRKGARSRAPAGK